MALLTKCFTWGSLVRLTAEFTDADDAAIDPDTVRVRWQSPDLSFALRVYLTDTDVIRDAAGKYHCDVDASDPGEWQFRWEGTGAGQAAEQGKFTVAASVFDGASP